jgi:hypothetical protein
MHEAVLRRAKVDAPQQVLGGYLLLMQFRQLAADVGEFLAEIGARVLVDLQDFQLDLGGLAA